MRLFTQVRFSSGIASYSFGEGSWRHTDKRGLADDFLTQRLNDRGLRLELPLLRMGVDGLGKGRREDAGHQA